MMYLLFLHCQITCVPRYDGDAKLNQETVDVVVSAVTNIPNEKLERVNVIK